MQILLCAATELEIKPTLAYILEHNLQQKVEPLVTGVGLVASTYSLTRRLAGAKPDLVIQAGVAGALSEELVLGQVVLVGSDAIGDEGVKEDGQFRSLFHLKLAGAHQAPFWDGKLVNSRVRELAHESLPVVDSVTVNQISTDAEQIAYYRDELGADIESMEGAALHYVCLMEGVPFVQLRSISNYIGERDKSKWLLREAVDRVNTEVQNILIKLL